MNIDIFQSFLLRHQLLNRGDRVIVAVSAGPDSVALLSLLCTVQLNLEPVAVYVDHGLRPDETVKETALVEKLAKLYNIKHTIERVDVQGYMSSRKKSIEESSRILRYRALERVCSELSGKSIAVGHTADDNAEELLLRLLRGTGLRGLSGMSLRRDRIIRPLLFTSKRDIIDYLKENDLTYCIDSSNYDRRFTRNQVRLDLLPLLAENYNPAIKSTLNTTSAIIREENSFIEAHVLKAEKLCVYSQVTTNHLPNIDINLLYYATLHVAVQRRIIERICWKYRVQPSFTTIESIRGLANQGESGEEIHLSDGLRACKSSGNLHFFQVHDNPRRQAHTIEKRPEVMAIEVEKTYACSKYGKKLSSRIVTSSPRNKSIDDILLDYDKLPDRLFLRLPEQGEKFRPSGMLGRKKVARFLSDRKIPRHLRYQYPVLASNDSIVAVLGLRPDRRYEIDNTTTRFLLLSWRDLPSP